MQPLARLLICFAVVWSAAWFGGQVFNALMVVPHFSRNPPASLIAWGEMRVDNLADFFVIFSPLWTLIALAIAFFISRNRSAGIAALAALASICFLVWMVPTISRLVSPNHAGLDAATVIQHLRQWTVTNWIRLAVDLVTFIASVRALTPR